MAKIYYEQDADLNVLKGKTVGIIGYGNQGRNQALNLKDSGIKVIIGEDADGLTGSFGTLTWKRAKPWLKTDWKTLAGVYQNAAIRLLELALPDEEVGDIQATVDLAPTLYSETQPAVRRIDLHGLREE